MREGPVKFGTGNVRRAEPAALNGYRTALARYARLSRYPTSDGIDATLGRDERRLNL